VYLWRISNYATLDGIGGILKSARWHTRGKPIIYTADHPASALLEMLVNTDVSLLPDNFQLLKIAVPADLHAHPVRASGNWRTDYNMTRWIGDEWLAEGKFLLLQVPSVIIPDAFHTLINPLHRDASRLKIISTQSVPLDVRLR
jgi:RES domain-containing protein